MTSLNSITLRDIQSSFDPDLVLKALTLCQQGRVEEVELDGEGLLSGLVVDGRTRYYASLSVRNNMLNMMCECGGMREGPCTHVLAILIEWITQENGEEPHVFEDLQALPAPPSAAKSTVQMLFLTPSQQEIHADWRRRLENLTVKELREIASARGIKLKGTLRDLVLDGLVEAVSTPEALTAALERLKPDARRLFDLFCVLPGTVPGFNLAQIGPYLAAVLAVEPKSRPMEECLADLERLGLFIQPVMVNFYPIPLQALTLPQPNPMLFRPYEGQISEISAVQPFHFTRLVMRLLLLAQGGRLVCAALPRSQGSSERLQGKGDWPVHSEAGKDAIELEILPEQPYIESGLRDKLAHSHKLPAELLDLAARMMENAGMWAQRSPQKVSDRLQAWLQLSPQAQSRRLISAAASFASQIELDLARSSGFTPWRAAKGSPGYKDFLHGLGAARLRLVRLLARAPLDQWLDIESILRMLHGLQPGWTMEYQSRQNERNSERFWDKYPLWAAIGKRKISPMNYEDWRMAYGQFYLTMLTRTLPWLGLIEVGSPAKNGQPAAVRLAAFGEFLIGRREDFPMPALVSAQPALALHDNGLLELDLDAAPLELVNLLVQIAIPEAAAHDGRLLYRISEHGVGQAYETGWTLDRVTGQLQEALRGPLPADLSGRLQSVWDHFGRLQIYEDMALIDLADDFALPELLAGTRLSQILVYTFSPRLVAVRASEVNAFVAELQAKGYTPRLEGDRSG